MIDRDKLQQLLGGNPKSVENFLEAFINEEVRSISLTEVSRFENGAYFLKIEMPGGEFRTRLMKISK